MTKKIGLMALGLSVVFLSGCGGGSNSEEPNVPVITKGTAYYVDSAVGGINYTCGEETGLTLEDGAFTFESGLSCIFSLGDIFLRDVEEVLLVDGAKVYETDVNIARILQSLDSDGDPKNGIAINADAVTALGEAGITSLPTTETEMEEMLQVIDTNGGTYLSQEDASAHLLTTLLAGNTLYTTIWDNMGTLESWTFSDDLSSSTWKELVGGSDSETGTFSVDGMTMTFTDSSGSATIVVTEIWEDYMLVSMNDGDAQRLYYSDTKARAYFLGEELSSINFETMLSGEIVYQVWYGMGEDANGNEIDNVAVVAKVTFNDDGTAEYLGLLNEGAGGTGKWEVTDNKLVVVPSDESFDYTEYNQYVSGDIASGCIQTNWVNENNSNDNNVDLYFTDETVALNYANSLTSTASCP